MFKTLSIVGILLLSQAACGEVQTVQNTLQATAESKQQRDRGNNFPSDYKILDPQAFLTAHDLANLEPREAAIQLLQKFSQESEGRKSEQISVEYLTPETAAVTVTIVGLADDSVRGVRYHLEFQRNGEGWEMVRVGSQSQCWEGRGHQEWSAALCS
ncbi:hypothetical protein IQ249_12420 [Lusitaniella coriacea LEGE 07157]|uniref:ARC6 IMS domain-containing protein n=1 Tax=Lusitaniella coriacea LEGE 07157 TaxID=945747 RepID=A0A8J7DXB8_9CYAN|nr:hypothetical protein [Lusitaniella coriacea]MBE9116705.1 hypothetical protein [Lusitaniella coriacea LEGE 07157]